jgi:hypothetical protein
MSGFPSKKAKDDISGPRPSVETSRLADLQRFGFVWLFSRMEFRQKSRFWHGRDRFVPSHPVNQD